MHIRALFLSAILLAMFLLVTACDDSSNVEFGDGDPSADGDQESGGDGDGASAGCTIQITSPKDAASTAESTIDVIANVDDADEASLSVNDGEATAADVVDGVATFSDVELELGENTIKINAEGEEGPCETEITVVRMPVLSFDNLNFTYDDDTSADAGAQVDVSLTGSPGASVELTVSGTGYASQEIGEDGTVVFADVALDPGLNDASAIVTKNGAQDEINDQLKLSGCRLIFAEMPNSLSDAGGDCETTCGDDLDCNAPNLQYDVVVSTENVGAGETASLEINGAGPFDATVGNNEVSFDMASLPDGTVQLIVSAEASEGDAGLTCEAEFQIPVEITCDCHLVVTPVPENYSSTSEDQDTETDGFQRIYTVSSDNCLDGSQIELDLNGNTSAKSLASGEATFKVSLEDDAHVLSWSIAEQDAGGTATGRTGAAGPYNIKVDRTAPTLSVNEILDGGTVNINHDIDLDISNGIQIRLTGIAEGVEELTPALEVSLQVETVVPTRADDYTAPVQANGAFEFASVDLAKPESGDPQEFALTFSVADELGNSVEQTINITAQFTEAGVVFTTIDGYTSPFAPPLVLNVGDDDDTETELMQFAVSIDTIQVDDGAVAQLVIDSGAPDETTVTSSEASWNVSLDNGEHTLLAKVQIGGENGAFIETDPIDILVAWSLPHISITDPTDDTWFNAGPIDVTANSDLGEGKEVTLTIAKEGSRQEMTATLDADGLAMFEDVAFEEGDGNYILTASAEDIAGNTAEDAITIHLDTVNPTPTVTAPTPGQEFTVDNDITVTVDLAGENDGLPATIELYNINDLGNPLFITSVAPETTSGEATHIFENLPDASYRADVEFTDEAGNTGTTTVNFIVNLGCWTATITTPSNHSYYGIADAYDGNTVNGVIVDVTVDASQGSLPATPFTAVTLYRDGSPLLNGLLDGSSMYTFLNVPMPSQGEYEFSVVIDKEGIADNCPASPNPLILTVDFTAPILAVEADLAKPDWPTDPTLQGTPIPYLAADNDSAPGVAGFQSSFTIDSNGGLEEGRDVMLMITDTFSRYSAEYHAIAGADGKATFDAVTLYKDGEIPYNTLLQLTASSSDIAGNPSNSYSFYAIADTQSPDFINIDPPQGLLTSNDDQDLNPDNGFQLEMKVTVEGGSPGIDALSVLVIPDEGAQYDLGTFDVPESLRATITGTFAEGGYTLRLTHTDDLGNTGTKDIYYDINYVAELELRVGETLMNGDTYVWNNTMDALPGTAGFQLNFSARTIGFEAGVVVALCSDQGLEGDPTLDACTVPGYFKVASGEVQISSGIIGLVNFYNVALKNESIHKVFIEGTDDPGNYDASPITTLDLDSLAPGISVFTIDTNNTDNDTTESIILTASEGTISGNQLLTNVSVTPTGDAESVELFFGGVSVAGPADFAGAAYYTFTSVPIDNGPGILTAQVEDDHGNKSSLSLAEGNLNLLTDIYAPTVAFSGGGAAIVLTQGDCSSTDINGNCIATNIGIIVTEQAGEQETLAGGTVRLEYPGSRYFEEKTIPTYGGNTVTIDFENFPVPQGDTTMTATATDPLGNVSTPVTQQFSVDSIAPTISFATPSPLVDPTEYDADDDDPTYGDGLNDLTITIANWAYNVSDISGETQIKLQKKLHSDPDIPGSWAYIGQAAANQTVSSDATGIPMIPLDFRRGDLDYRLEATETASGNVAYSDPVHIIIDFNVSFGIVLEKVSGDSQIGTADDLEDGAKFNYLEDQNSDPSIYGMNIRIVTNAPEGLIPDLYIGGEGGTLVSHALATNGTGEIVGGIVEYNNISIPEAPATTDLWVEVNYPPTDHGEYEVTNIWADGERPQLEFTRPVGSSTTYNYDSDTIKATYGQLKLGSGDAIQITADQIKDGIVATITAKDSTGGDFALLGTTTASFTSNVATFSDLIFPNTNGFDHIVLTVTTEDFAGNPSELDATIQVIVDDDPPSEVTPSVCIGGDTNFEASPPAYQTEPANCSEGYGCGDPNESDRCNRRAGTVTLYWDAAENNDNEGIGTVASYQVHWVRNTTTPTTPCNGVSWTTPVNPSGASVTLGPIAAPGNTQYATVTGLDVNSNTSYCFLVKATDEVGNTSLTTVAVPREVNFIVDNIATPSTPIGAGFNASPWVEWGDFNADGLDDLVVSDPEAGGFMGAVYIYYGREDGQTPPVADVTINGAVMGFGWELAVGNFNGDTTAGGVPIMDLAIGAVDSGTFAFEGAVFIHLGAETTGLSTTAASTITHVAGSGKQLAQAMDALNWDGDEYTDLVISSAPFPDHECPVYLFLGRETWSASYTAGDNSAPAYKGDADLVIQRDLDDTGTTITHFGIDLGHADLDNDGLDDILITHRDFNDVSNSDRLYILWADAQLTDGISEGDNPEPDFIRPGNGVANFSYLSGNGGFGQPVRGIPSTDTLRGDEAESFMAARVPNVFHYRGTTGLQDVPTALPQTWEETGNSEFGMSVGWAGDLNNDGYNDLFMTGESLLRVVYGEDAASYDESVEIPGVFDSGATQGLRANGGLDFNGDSMLDMAVVNKDTGEIFIIK